MRRSSPRAFVLLHSHTSIHSTMAGGKPDLDAGGDSLRQWQVNSDAGTLQGWGVTSGASATPAQAATAESFEHSEVAAQTSASATYCPLNPAHQSEEPSGKDGDSDDSIDPQRLQACNAENLGLFLTADGNPMKRPCKPTSGHAVLGTPQRSRAST